MKFSLKKNLPLFILCRKSGFRKKLKISRKRFLPNKGKSRGKRRSKEKKKNYRGRWRKLRGSARESRKN